MPALDPTILLAHGDFVTALARSLVADPARADDVVQDTWLAALTNPPRDASRLRAWLAAVTRNFARQSSRAEARVRGREEHVARSEGVSSTAELCEREATRRALIDALLELSEPQRAALVLRFYEGLPPREIARRLSIPVETARTRIKRGLVELRRRLDERYGDEGRDWCEALAPLALELQSDAASPASFPLALSAAACVAVAVTLGLWLGTRESTPDPRAVAPSTAEAVSVLSDPAVTGELSGEETRVPIAASSAGRKQPAPAPQVVRAPLTPPARSITGRVLDADDAPIPGAIVYLGTQIRGRGDEPFKPFRSKTFDDCESVAGSGCTHADDAGQFTLEGSDRYVTAWHANHGARTVPWSEAGTIVLHSKGKLAGKLVDGSGAPIAEREITLDRERATVTDAGGAFEFEGVEVGLRGLLVSLEGDKGPPAKQPSGLTPRKKGTWFGVLVDRAPNEPVTLVLHDAAQPFALSSSGAPFLGKLELVPIGLERVFRMPADSAKTSSGSFELAGLSPGRHVFLTRTGQIARADIPPASSNAAPIDLDLGACDLTIRAPAGTRVYVVPRGSGEFVELMAGRQSSQTVSDGGEARIAPLPAGSYDVGIDSRGIVTQVEVHGTGTTVILE